MSSSVPCLNHAQLQAALGIRDLCDPAEGPHAIQVLINGAVEALARAWSCEVRWCRGPKVVPVADNYDRGSCTAGTPSTGSTAARLISLTSGGSRARP